MRKKKKNKRRIDDLSIQVSRLRRSITRSNSKTMDSFRRSKVKVSGAREEKGNGGRKSEEVKSEEATWRQLNGNRRFTHSYVTEASSGFASTILIIQRLKNGIRKIRSIVGYIFFLANPSIGKKRTRIIFIINVRRYYCC